MLNVEVGVNSFREILFERGLLGIVWDEDGSKNCDTESEEVGEERSARRLLPTLFDVDGDTAIVAADDDDEDDGVVVLFIFLVIPRNSCLLTS